MSRKIIDFVKNSEKRIISPIWGGRRTFGFACMGHLQMSQALGFELERVSDNLWIVKEGQLKSKEDLEIVIENKTFHYGFFDNEINYLYNAKQWEPHLIWGGGCFGPLTVVSGILGAENLMRLVVKDPEFVERFVAYVTDFMIELAVREKEYGQELFWIAEPVASLLAPKRFWRFSGQYLKKIFDAAGVPGFLHVCGKTTKHTKLLEETGAQVLSIDYCTDIGECIREVGPDTIIMGNVSPMNLKFGTKEEVEEEVTAILDACKGFPNFIMSTGCIIMDGTPEENMQVIFDVTERYE